MILQTLVVFVDSCTKDIHILLSSSMAVESVDVVKEIKKNSVIDVEQSGHLLLIVAVWYSSMIAVNSGIELTVDDPVGHAGADTVGDAIRPPMKDAIGHTSAVTIWKPMMVTVGTIINTVNGSFHEGISRKAANNAVDAYLIIMDQGAAPSIHWQHGRSEIQRRHGLVTAEQFRATALHGRHPRGAVVLHRIARGVRAVGVAVGLVASSEVVRVHRAVPGFGVWMAPGLVEVQGRDSHRFMYPEFTQTIVAMFRILEQCSAAT